MDVSVALLGYDKDELDSTQAAWNDVSTPTPWPAPTRPTCSTLGEGSTFLVSLPAAGHNTSLPT